MWRTVNEVDLNDFKTLDDYLLLSSWLESMNRPICINKKNYYTDAQKLLAKGFNQSTDGTQVAREILRISKTNFRSLIHSIPDLSRMEDHKKLHQTLRLFFKSKAIIPQSKDLQDLIMNE